MRLTLPLAPASNRYWRVWRGRAVMSNEARAYKEAVHRLGLALKAVPLEGRVKVSLWVFRQRKSGDLDGRIKVCLDSLQGVAYVNDSQVVELHAYLGDDKKCPRIEVEVEEARGAP